MRRFMRKSAAPFKLRACRCRCNCDAFLREPGQTFGPFPDAEFDRPVMADYAILLHTERFSSCLILPHPHLFSAYASFLRLHPA